MTSAASMSRTPIVSPWTSTVSAQRATLPTYTWYDPAGNVIKSETGTTGAFTKYQYDALGQLTMTYTGYDTSEPIETTGTWAAAVDLSDNVILQQTQTWYDAASEPVASATYQRFAETADTDYGPLGAGPTGAVPSYATASATWYDALGRTVETVNFGREDTGAASEDGGHRHFFTDSGSVSTANDGGLWTNQQSPGTTFAPNSSDNYIVSQTIYDPDPKSAGGHGHRHDRQRRPHHAHDYR